MNKVNTSKGTHSSKKKKFKKGRPPSKEIAPAEKTSVEPPVEVPVETGIEAEVSAENEMAKSEETVNYRMAVLGDKDSEGEGDSGRRSFTPDDGSSRRELKILIVVGIVVLVIGLSKFYGERSRKPSAVTDTGAVMETAGEAAGESAMVSAADGEEVPALTEDAPETGAALKTDAAEGQNWDVMASEKAAAAMMEQGLVSETASAVRDAADALESEAIVTAAATVPETEATLEEESAAVKAEVEKLRAQIAEVLAETPPATDDGAETDMTAEPEAPPSKAVEAMATGITDTEAGTAPVDIDLIAEPEPAAVAAETQPESAETSVAAAAPTGAALSWEGGTDSCKMDAFDIVFACDKNWPVENSDAAAPRIVVSSTPYVTMTLERLDSNVRFLGQVSKKFLSGFGLYKDNFSLQRRNFGGQEAVLVKALSADEAVQIRAYYYLHNNNLFRVSFEAPGHQWTDAQFVIKAITDSVSRL